MVDDDGDDDDDDEGDDDGGGAPTLTSPMFPSLSVCVPPHLHLLLCSSPPLAAPRFFFPFLSNFNSLLFVNFSWVIQPLVPVAQTGDRRVQTKTQSFFFVKFSIASTSSQLSNLDPSYCARMINSVWIPVDIIDTGMIQFGCFVPPSLLLSLPLWVNCPWQYELTEPRNTIVIPQ